MGKRQKASYNVKHGNQELICLSQSCSDQCSLQAKNIHIARLRIHVKPRMIYGNKDLSLHCICPDNYLLSPFGIYHQSFIPSAKPPALHFRNFHFKHQPPALHLWNQVKTSLFFFPASQQGSCKVPTTSMLLTSFGKKQ